MTLCPKQRGLPRRAGAASLPVLVRDVSRINRREEAVRSALAIAAALLLALSLWR